MKKKEEIERRILLKRQLIDISLDEIREFEIQLEALPDAEKREEP